MKRTDLPQRFQDLLRRIPYVTIATVCPDGRPWNTPLVGYFDDQLNLYWASDTLSQHSLNIARNPVIFTVIYDSNAPLGEGEALYLQMTARRLAKQKDIAAAKNIYLDRYGEFGHEPFVGMCPRRIYQAQPIALYNNTAGRRRAHFVDKRNSLVVR